METTKQGMVSSQELTGAVDHEQEIDPNQQGSRDAHPGAAAELDWEEIDWPALEREVNRFQTRIVKAEQEGRWNKVKSLQYLLTRSRAAKLLAVRRVTENEGSKTPGVDGQT